MPQRSLHKVQIAHLVVEARDKGDSLRGKQTVRISGFDYGQIEPATLNIA